MPQWAWIMMAGEAAIFGTIALVWFFAKITAEPPNYWVDRPEDYIRGGCVLVLVAAVGLVAVAALLWAWRYLFGS